MVYKQWYRSCFSCIGFETEWNNNCLTCKSGMIKYPFNEHHCLSVKIETCINSQNYGTLINNNIECIICDKKIVL